MDTPNIGEIGVESIRIAGKRIEDLAVPIEAIKAVQQLPEALETERQNKIANVRRRYPTADIDFLRSKIEGCHHNIRAMHQLIAKERSTVNEFSGIIALCNQRDKELSNAIGEMLVASIRGRYPPYETEAMEKQVKQCNDGIERAEVVIKNENKSIQEVAGAIAQCEERDYYLKELGEEI